MMLLTWALINKGKTELLVFARMPLKYAANTCIMESKINLQGNISKVTVPCRRAVAVGTGNCRTGLWEML